jgi:hypothetical protein
MAEKRPNPNKPEGEPRKKEKAADTVQLTAEDLRKISGGAKLGTNPPKTQEITKKP